MHEGAPSSHHPSPDPPLIRLLLTSVIAIVVAAVAAVAAAAVAAAAAAVLVVPVAFAFAESLEERHSFPAARQPVGVGFYVHTRVLARSIPVVVVRCQAGADVVARVLAARLRH